MNILVCKTYSYVRFIGDQGDYEDANGWIDEGTLMTVPQAIEELKGYPEPSSSHLTPESCQGDWFSRHLDTYECNEEDGDWEGGEESIFLKRADGSPLSSRHLFRLFRAAGHTTGKL